jgi:hypothetical protein
MYVTTPSSRSSSPVLTQVAGVCSKLCRLQDKDKTSFAVLTEKREKETEKYEMGKNIRMKGDKGRQYEKNYFPQKYNGLLH